MTTTQLRVLWVKVGGLWPPNLGGRQRSFQMLAELAAMHRVTLLTTHAEGEDAEALRKALPSCERVVSVQYQAPKAGTAGFARALAQSWFSPLPADLFKWRVPELQETADRILKNAETDLCIVDFLHAAANVPLDTAVPVVLFAHNVEYTIWKRLAESERNPLRRALLEIEWRKFRRYEHEVAARAATVVAVSPVDAARIRDGAPRARTRAIATGVDTAYFHRNGIPERSAHLVFTGAMDWYPNEDGVIFFCDEILPAIRRELPDITMTVAGRNPSPRLRDAASKAGVNVTGTVDDVRPYIDEAAVYVVPLRVGGGTRLKIFEALAMSKAVVSTSIGAEGLPLVDGEHFVRADSAAGFASAVVALAKDADRRRSLGAAGCDLVRRDFSWKAVARQFDRHCQEALLTR